MTIYDRTLEDLRRYTFLDKVERKGVYIYLTYGNKEKRISHRASGKQLQNLINKIKNDVGFEETKEKRDVLVKKELAKPMMFANIGENDEK